MEAGGQLEIWEMTTVKQENLELETEALLPHLCPITSWWNENGDSSQELDFMKTTSQETAAEKTRNFEQLTVVHQQDGCSQQEENSGGLSQFNQSKFWRPWSIEAESFNQFQQALSPSDNTNCHVAGFAVVRTNTVRWSNETVHKIAVINPVRKDNVLNGLEHRHINKTRKKINAVRACGKSVKKPFPCSRCTSSFTTNQSLQRHVMTVHERHKQYQCKFCDRAFLSKMGIEGHLRREHLFFGKKDPKDFICPVCNKILTGNRRLLEIHMMRKHKPVKPFSCPVCSKQFAENLALKRHVACVHDPQRTKLKTLQNPNCPFCNKSFVGNNHKLRVHIRTHTGEKPFTCSECPYKAAIAGNLKAHVDSVHKRRKPFNCSVCGKIFSSKKGMVSHEKTQHLSPETNNQPVLYGVC